MTKKTIRCKNCNFLNEADMPDDLHPYATNTKPNDSGVDGDVIEKTIDCRNPNCLRPILVYWYLPKAGIDFL